MKTANPAAIAARYAQFRATVPIPEEPPEAGWVKPRAIPRVTEVERIQKNRGPGSAYRRRNKRP